MKFLAMRRSQCRLLPEPQVRVASQLVVADLLSRNHMLQLPTSFVIVVEGETDCRYLRAAASLASQEFGEDLLGLDGADADGNRSITVCTPVNPNHASTGRGGLVQVTQLASDLLRHVIEYELPSPICFLLDHDEAGMSAAKKIREWGYNIDRARVETHQPARHPLACRAKAQNPTVVIEDLLSIRVQRAFLAEGTADCDVCYRDGQVVRYIWTKESKSSLCDYVCTRGRVSDVVEVLRAIVHVRRLWRLPELGLVGSFLQHHGGEAA